jgi:hypothetical protein
MLLQLTVPEKQSVLVTFLFPKAAVNYFLYHSRVIFVCLIFFCSWKMPYIRASDVGGPTEPMLVLIFDNVFSLDL